MGYLGKWSSEAEVKKKIKTKQNQCENTLGRSALKLQNTDSPVLLCFDT